MRAKDLRALGDDELRKKQNELTETLFHLRLRRAIGQLENPMKARQTRRELARVMTVLHERERAGHVERPTR
jgi:large subunit ribosomal protein L29